jgi:hypothetical protein
VIVLKCSGGDSTAEVDVGILEAKIGGCHLEIQFEIQRERQHASVDDIHEGILLTYDDLVPTHIKTKYLT